MPENPWINSDNSHIGNMAMTDKTIPSDVNPRSLPVPSSNVVSASGSWTGGGGRGRGRRRRSRSRTKISRQYMRKRSSRRHRSRRHRRHRVKSRRSCRLCPSCRRTERRRRMRYRGGGPAMAPAYPAGHTQFESNKVWSNNYSTGGVHLAPNQSALATPPPIQRLAPEVDNLNHNAPNAFGHNVGSGFPSRGWF